MIENTPEAERKYFQRQIFIPFLPNIPPFLSDWKAQVEIYGRWARKAVCNLRVMLETDIFPTIRHVKLHVIQHESWKTVLLKRSLKKT